MSIENSELSEHIRNSGGPSPDKDPNELGTPATCELVVDGKKISNDIAHMELRQYIDNHHVLKLRARELGQVSAASEFFSVSSYTGFLGKTITLTVTPSGDHVDKSHKLEFIGIVTAVEIESGIGALNIATLTAHSPTISMDGSKKNAFFHEMSASDITGSIVRNYQMNVGTMETTSGNMEYCVQYRESDYNFVMRLATGGGLFAFYDGKEFRIMKAAKVDVATVTWRQDLSSFAVEWGTAPGEYASQVYNYEQKKIFAQDSKSMSSTSALSNLSRVSPEASKKIFPNPGFIATSKSIADAQTLDRSLMAAKKRAMGRMITCKGCSIMPTIAVGHCVKITQMAELEGDYWVSKVTHIFDETGTYYNRFTCTPVEIAFPQFKSSRGSVTSLQSAVVVDNIDPDEMGRIKVKFPWNESDETPWVRYVMPYAGNDRGWYALPEIDDEVLVGYEEGSPDHPIAIGSVFNKVDVPPADAHDDKNSIKMFKSRSGHVITISDKDGDEQISIVGKDGSKIVMSSSDSSIVFETSGDFSIKANNIKLESQAAFEIKAGSNAKIEASANLDAKGGAMVKVEGAMTTVKGNPIQLN